MNNRSAKRRKYRRLSQHLIHPGRRYARSCEETMWLNIAPVGLEFGSPDFERLSYERAKRRGTDY